MVSYTSIKLVNQSLHSSVNCQILCLSKRKHCPVIKYSSFTHQNFCRILHQMMLYLSSLNCCFKYVSFLYFRKERDKSTFSFHVNNEWAGGVKVSKDGVGMIKVWKQQLQQFRNVSPEIAAAIIAEYPSPQLLLQVSACWL